MKRIIAAVTLILAAGAASADPAEGLWQTEPDRKALISHIRVTSCGAALCGQIVAAFDSAGTPVQTPNVGKRLFWDLQPAGGGSYEGGTVYVPLLDITARATAQLDGNQLEVTGCKALVCDGQTWRRID